MVSLRTFVFCPAQVQIHLLLESDALGQISLCICHFLPAYIVHIKILMIQCVAVSINMKLYIKKAKIIIIYWKGS